MNAQNKSFEYWNEIRIAYHVARLGTLSAAGEYLGVHHATVIRHIDTLEQKLGCKLFHRHARGYTPTDAGKDLMQTAAASDDQFAQLAARLAGQSDTISGELIVTTLSGLSFLFSPILIAFQQANPEIRINLLVDERRLQLEYGEAHVALRAGPKPQEPDNVVQLLGRLPMSLYAHKSYVAEYGIPETEADFANHKFVANAKASIRAPFNKWLQENISDDQVVFRAPQMRSIEDAIIAGAGIGFLTEAIGTTNQNLVQMIEGKPEWDTQIWMVTHMDVHRSAKVQAFLSFLKARFLEQQTMSNSLTCREVAK